MTAARPDYDDWNLNGDLLYYSPLLDQAIELSSMGIRVDSESLDRQLTLAGCDARRSLPFHRMLLDGELPLTIGGGHWPEPHVYALAWQGAHRRGPVLHLGCGHTQPLP